ncbi:trypsin, alkaline B-like [Manduca sexta]|uniref:trypsin, alkaline B-like n=1 Tax=Manduca sexta TaxID=7130 RepID=UPI00188FAE98|nr:trypsin, alkaline B-like [Manduca sexta]XP_037301225.1 trypsin, alkaline B-like [Manduca sexta]
MRLFLALLALGFAAVAAVPANPQRIVGGSPTTIQQYPTIVAVLFSWEGNTFHQHCGGTILNNRTILTAAHCPYNEPVNRWRIRTGSTFANSGGVVHNVNSYRIYPKYNPRTLNNDIAIMRTASIISFNNAAQPARIAGPNYIVGDNQVVWAAGWGALWYQGPGSERLRHVQVWTVNMVTCRARYAAVGAILSDSMLCSGWLDVGGRDQCQGDSGGPLYHNGVVVGVCSWGHECALPNLPGINARVSRFANWIRNNA